MTKTRLYMIFGKSGSGKDTLQKEMINKIGLNPIIQYTTRPKRPFEKEGEQYHFLTKEEFDNTPMICRKDYDTANGVWSYGIPEEIVSDGTPMVIILNPYQIREFLKHYEHIFDIVTIYVTSDEELRIVNAIKRERGKEQPDYAELTRRIVSDRKDFSYEWMKDIIRRSITITNHYENDLEEIAKNLPAAAERHKKELKYEKELKRLRKRI